MDNQFTFWEIWLMLFGFGYVVNHHTKEIHRLSEKHRNCKLEGMAKHNSEHITRRHALRLIKKYHYNGCRWCWGSQDNG